MAVLVLTDARVEVNSVVLSDHATEVSLPVKADDVETTAFGATWRTRAAGLKDGEVQIKFNQDYAASNVDATLWAAFGTSVTVKVRPTSASISATNPEYSAAVIVTEHTPVAGSVGDLATLDVTWSTNGAVSRATS